MVSQSVEQPKVSLLRLISWSTKFTFHLLPMLYSVSAVLIFLESLKKFFNIVIIAKFVDSLVTTQDKDAAIWYLVLFIGYNLVYTMVDSFRFINDQLFKHNEYKMELVLIDKLKHLPIHVLEDPAFNNKLELARTSINYPFSLSRRTLVTLGSLLVALLTGVFSLQAEPMVVVAILLLIIPKSLINNKMLSDHWQFMKSTIEDRRKAGLNVSALNRSSSLIEIVVTDSHEFFRSKIKSFYENFIRVYSKMTLGRRGLGLIFSLISVGLIFYFGLNLIQDPNVSVGAVIFQVGALVTFYESVSFLAGMFTALGENSLRVQEVYDVLMFETDVKAEKKVRSKLKTLSRGIPPEIECRDVTFSYPSNEREVLRNVSLTIEPQKKIAIVGHNGAGKTTLIKLLLGLYSPQNGNIFVGGEKLDSIDPASWYDSVGMLAQEYNTYPHLSARDNIVVGDLKAKESESMLEQVADRAEALGFINQFPNKFDQILGENFVGGIRPSTGQWQKIAIARFLYRNRPIIVLDEPTSAIDPISEFNIFNKIYNFLEKKTVIIISHRFSTVRKADIIFVMNEGRIVESGSHEELMAKKGYYAEAFTVQAKEYGIG